LPLAGSPTRFASRTGVNTLLQCRSQVCRLALASGLATDWARITLLQWPLAGTRTCPGLRTGEKHTAAVPCAGTRTGNGLGENYTAVVLLAGSRTGSGSRTGEKHTAAVPCAGTRTGNGLGENYTAAVPLAGSRTGSGSWTGEEYTAAVLLASLPIGNGLPPSRCNFEISTNDVSNYTALKPGTDLQLPTTQPRFKNRRQTYWNRGRTD
jgi:hypothetical protein